MLLISPFVGLSMLAAGVLASPYPSHVPMPRARETSASLPGTLAVRQDASGSPYVITSDQKVLQDQVHDNSDIYSAERLSTGLLGRDVEPFCFCKEESGSCIKEEPVVCLEPSDDDEPYQLAQSSYSERSQASFCLCATYGNGTCVPETEYCKDDSGNPPHQPFCMCVHDQNGVCKEKTSICSDNISPPAKDIHNSVVKRQGVTGNVPPPEPRPALSVSSFDTPFYLALVDYTKDIYLQKPVPMCQAPGFLTMNLTDGILTDNNGRRGYIASNRQLQFDEPPQSGAMYTSGFYMLNGFLGLHGTPDWWSCASADYVNIYDDEIADYCDDTLLQVNPVADGCNDSEAESDSDSD